MSDPGSEGRLAALFAALDAAFAGDALRNQALPSTVPASGLLIQNDGDPGAPEYLLSPLQYEYTHPVEILIFVQAGSDGERRPVATAARTALGAAIEADRTLGGLCDWVDIVHVGHDEIPIEGAAPVRQDTLRATLTYSLTTPLA